MQNLDNLLDTSSSWVGMCHAFYRHPTGKPVKLDTWQEKVFNVMQFGDDINEIPVEYIRPHYYVLICCPRQVGKTFLVKEMAATIGPIYDDLFIGCYGPHDKRAKILLKKIKDAIKYSDFYSSVNWKRKSKEHLEFLNGTEVNSFNTSEMQIRGDTEDVQLIDEADFIYDDDLIYQSIEPKTIIPRQRGWGKILMISTPNVKNEGSVFKTYYMQALDSRKLFCQVCGKIHDLSSFLSSRVEESDFVVYEVPKNLDNCGCGGEKFVYYYDSDKTIVSVNPKQHPRIPWPVIKERLDARNWSPRARQEYLGEIISGAGGMFPIDCLTRMESMDLHNYKYPPDNWDPDEHETSAGLDYGKVYDNTVLTITEKTSNEYKLLSLQVIESVVENPSWEDIRKFVKKPLVAWNPGCIVSDCTGLGSESSARMSRDVVKWNLDTEVISNKPNHIGFYIEKNSKREIVNNLEETVKSTQLRIPPVHEPWMKELRGEFLNFGYEVTKASNIIYKAMRGHDDMVISLALSLIGYKYNEFPAMLDSIKGFTR